MRDITIDRAIELLQECSAVIVDDNAATYPSVRKDEDEWLVISWDDNEGLEWIYTFDRTACPKIENNVMFLIDIDGEGCELTLLMPMILTR